MIGELGSGLGNSNCLTRTRLLDQLERVHWTGLHRLLDITTGIVSMPRTRLLDQLERGAREAERQREKVSLELQGLRAPPR